MSAVITERLEAIGITARCASGELTVEGTRELSAADIRWVSDQWQELGQVALAAATGAADAFSYAGDLPGRFNGLAEREPSPAETHTARPCSPPLAPANPKGPSELTWPKALTELDRLSLTFWARLSPQERARSEMKPVHALERLMRVAPALAAHLAGASPSSDAQPFPPQAEFVP